MIAAEGKWDFVVGNPATVFSQVNRADAPGFALEPLSDANKKVLSANLMSINKNRDEELKNFVLNQHNSKSIGNNYLNARGENIMAIRDFALIGLVKTDHKMQTTSKKQKLS
eukprot:12186037-Ditylum_brightwellii.AAC.1